MHLKMYVTTYMHEIDVRFRRVLLGFDGCLDGCAEGIEASLPQLPYDMPE